MKKIKKRSAQKPPLPESQKYEKLVNVTAASLKKHTGKTWDQWIEILNKAGAMAWTYQETTAYLAKKYKATVWWKQWITIGYENAMGKRIPGRSLKGDYTITVTRTVHVDHKKVWQLIASDKGLAIWLRPMSKFKLGIKQTFETDAGVFGEIRTMLAPRRIRFTWQEGDWEKSTTVQLFLVPRKNGSTIICFMHEKLRDGRLRTPLREHWSQVVDELVASIKS